MHTHKVSFVWPPICTTVLYAVAQNNQYSLWYLLASMESAFGVSFRLDCFYRDTRERMHFLWSFGDFLYWLPLCHFLLLTYVDALSSHLLSFLNLVRENFKRCNYFYFHTSGSKLWLLFWIDSSHFRFVIHGVDILSILKSRVVSSILDVQCRQ